MTGRQDREPIVPTTSFPAGPDIPPEIAAVITEHPDSPRRKLASLYAQGRRTGEAER